VGSGFADRPGVPAGSRPREPTDSLRLTTGRQAETEAASIRYVAEMQGADMGSERTIRWLITLMVLCCFGQRGQAEVCCHVMNADVWPHLRRHMAKRTSVDTELF
jgi:hypothetical protein